MREKETYAKYTVLGKVRQTPFSWVAENHLSEEFVLLGRGLIRQGSQRAIPEPTGATFRGSF